MVVNIFVYFLKAVFLLTLFWFFCLRLAYSVPNAGSLLNFEEEIEKVNVLPIQIPKEDEIINGVSGKNGEKVLIKGFKFEGKKNGFTSQELEKILEDLIGKNLSFEEIQNAANKIQSFYREAGYFLAQAYIPEQEVKDVPRSKEALYYRRIFDKLFPNRTNIVPRWIPRTDWEGVSYDPSGRAQTVHNSTTVTN